jgi:dethiobiotin synthetase
MVLSDQAPVDVIMPTVHSQSDRLLDRQLFPKDHYLVTGSDTGVGKSHFSCRLLETLAIDGDRVIGLKPVAAGGRIVNGIVQNDDAIALRNHGTLQLPYAVHSPYTLRSPVSPDIAAPLDGVVIKPERIAALHARLRARAWSVTEGLGGWRVPLAPGFGLDRLAGMLDCRVVVVVALRVGCINHALLTLESVARSSAILHGWVANRIDTAGQWDGEMVETIARESGLQPLAVLAHDRSSQQQP